MNLKTWCEDFFEHESKYYLSFLLYISLIVLFIEGCIVVLQIINSDIIHGETFGTIALTWVVFSVLMFSYYSMVRDQEDYNKCLETAIKEISEIVEDDLKTCKIKAIIEDRL